MTHLIKDTFYKEKLYQLSLTSFSQAETFMVKDKSQAKQLAKQELPIDIIECSLGNFAKTAEGPNYAYLSFICTNKAIYTINGIDRYRHLQHVDISYNNLLTLKPLGELKFMLYLNASHNKLTKLLDFKQPPKQLTEVDCSHNDIEHIPCLKDHRFLKKLDLSNNKIQKIEGLNQNLNLHTLKIANNEIEQIENLDDMNLIHLDLFGNNIAMITGLNKVPKLRKLDLSHNHISKLSGIIDLISLRELRLSNNKIRRIKELSFLENLVYLSVLDLCFNPAQNRRYYKMQVLYKLPGLRTLDGVLVTPEEIVKAENLYGMDLEDRKRIFKDILQDEEYIDRRIHVSELIEPETDSDNEDTEFVEQYDPEGNLIKQKSRTQFDAKSQKSLSEMYHTGKSLQDRGESITVKSQN